jgi:tetratricopeptide (TPR) repeat protein
MVNSSALPTDSRLQRLLGFLEEDPANLALRTDIFETALHEAAFDIAEQQVEHVLSEMPGDPAWEHRLALLRIAQRRYAEAEAIIANLLDRNQGNAAVRYNLAYVAFCEARYQRACEILSPMVDEPETPGDTLPLLLRCLHRLGSLTDALTLFKQRAAQGKAPEAAYGIASLMAVDAGQMAEAAAWSERALRSEPSQLEALTARGTVALAARDADAAMRYLERALAVNPKDGRTWSAYGLASMLRMQLDQALQHFRNAVAYMPNHIGTWHGMGWCQLMLKNAPAAQISFERALELDRNFGESHGGLAVTLALQGRTADAQAHIERALRLDPQNLSARYAQAILSGEVNDTERFRKLAERVLGARTAADGRSLADVILRRGR